MFKNKTTRNWVIGLAVLTTVVVISLVVYAKTLRTINPSKVKRKAVRLAKEQLEYWENGKIKEGNAKTMQRLRDYWQIGSKVNASDNYYISTPWSGAFISYLMRESGAENNFKYSSSHTDYIRQAIRNRKEDNENPIKAYRPSEVEVEEGDLVCYPRQSGVTYDTEGYYISHCDLVVNINKRKDIAESVGGNVSNSVKQTDVPLTNDGKIDTNKASKYFVVIKIGGK